MRRRIHPTTLAVLVTIVVAASVAAAVTRSVRDANEERLLDQRADGVGQIVAGLGSSYEADLMGAAAVAGMGTQQDLADHVADSTDETNAMGTWALVERTAAGDRAVWVEPAGATTYFDGAHVSAFDRQLDRAFRGEFVVAGLFGTGMDRRLGVARGVPGAADRIVYLEFPLLAVATADGGDDAEVFSDLDVGLYVGGQPSAESLIFATYEGGVPEDAKVVELPVGGQAVSVVVKALRPLGGSLADALPWIVLGFGVSVAALAALLVEVSRRRQEAAVALAEELTAKNHELDLAIGEQARAEADLVEAQRREAIGQLAGGVAHDFNNLLAVIVAYAGLAKDAVDDPDVRADIEEISAAAERGAALTRQLLLFARKDTVTTSGETATIDDVLRDMSRLLERSVSDDVRLTFDLRAPSTAVHISTTALEQIAVNLVVNARDALVTGGEIHLRTAIDPGSDRVVLEVEDDGCGMPAEVAVRAFEPFFSTKDRASGTGLGLATVRSIVEGAGGRVDISSTPDVGTTIRIALPASAAETPTVTAASVPAPGESVRILLVEDEDGVRRAMRRMLERNGHRVYEATSGVDAVQRYLDASEPHLLLTDAVMPGGMSGKDLAERFRTRHPGLPVVYVSGYDFDLLASRGIEEEQGPLRVLAKPFTETQLVAAVSEALGDLTPA